MVQSFRTTSDLEWARAAVVVHVGHGVSAVSAASCAADLCIPLHSPGAMLTGCQRWSGDHPL